MKHTAELLSRPNLQKLGVLAGSLLLTGCATTVRANTQTITPCDGNGILGNSRHQVTSASKLMEQATADLNILYKRTMTNKGIIDFPDPNSQPELRATPKELTLTRFSPDFLGGNTDIVHFPVEHGTVEAPTNGTFLCTAARGLYETNGFVALQQYVTETASLDR